MNEVEVVDEAVAEVVDEVVDEVVAESLKGETLRNRIPRGNARIFGPRGPKAIGRAGSPRRHFLP